MVRVICEMRLVGDVAGGVNEGGVTVFRIAGL